MYIPDIPTLREKYQYIESGRFQIYILSTITTAILLIGMALFVWINPLFFPYTFFVIVSAIYLFASYGIGLTALDFDLKRHYLIVARWIEKSVAEEVDIFLPICGEHIDVLQNTWHAVFKLKVNHEIDGGKVNVHVLDDAKSELCRKLAERFKFNYMTRDSNELKKAGNLRNAFGKTSAPYIVIFDADFCPRPDFLVETLPYMYENADVGIVQTPQYFETRCKSLNVIERGSAQIQELFYRLIQVSRNHYRGAICVGTSALYRRDALEPYGGTAPIQWSEDVHTAVMMMKDGKRVQYLPLILSKGACPDQWKQFFTQFYRWATGSLSLMKDPSFWKSKLSVMQKICFLTGFGFYVTTGLAALLAFFPSLFLLVWKPELLKWYNLLWSLPSLFLTNIYLRFWQTTGYSFSAIQCRAVSSYAHLFALIDIFAGKTEAWVPTGTSARSGRFDYFLRFVLWHNVILIGLLLMLGIYRLPYVGPVNLIPLTLLVTYHLASLWPVLRLAKEKGP